MKQKNHYVDNKKFNKEVTEYTNSVNESISNGTEVPDIPEYLAQCILKMVYSIASRSNFSGYSYIEDMIGDGIEYSLLCLKRGSFIPEKGSAFSYFTTIIWNCFLKRKILEEEEQMVHRNLILNTDFSKIGIANTNEFNRKYKDYMDRTQSVSDYFDKKNKRIKEIQEIQKIGKVKRKRKPRKRIQRTRSLFKKKKEDNAEV